VKNKDPPEACLFALAVALLPRTADFYLSMKIKKSRKTLDDIKCVLGILVNLAALIYAILKIVAHH
jgi:hypothetical protein